MVEKHFLESLKKHKKLLYDLIGKVMHRSLGIFQTQLYDVEMASNMVDFILSLNKAATSPIISGKLENDKAKYCHF